MQEQRRDCMITGLRHTRVEAHLTRIQGLEDVTSMSWNTVAPSGSHFGYDLLRLLSFLAVK